MTAVLKSNTGVSVAESVLNDITSRTSRYYYYLGKILSWNQAGLDAPEMPLENYQYELKARSNIISTKRIRESDVSFVIKRIDWVSNKIYDIYDDAYSLTNLSYSGSSSLENAIFYVVTDESNVYKCISNNYNSISTSKPIGNDVGIVKTADGYQWKFMYNIPIGFRNKFFESGFMPITNSIRNQFYSNGQISNITIENGGVGYVQASTSIIVTGDGYFEENPYILNGIVITDGGFGYQSTPLVTISFPLVTIGAEIQATGSITLSSTSILSGTLTNIGYGYDTSATIIIAEPISTYTVWQSGITVSVNQKIKYIDNYYNVTIAGNLGTTPPTHSSGIASNGTTTLAFIAKRAKAILTSTKTNARVNPIVASTGEITGAIIIDGGVGYSYVNLEIQGIGTGGKLSVDLSNGDLNTLQANVELLAVNGALSYIKVENKGSGYTSANIVIQGDGTDAKATAILNSGNIVNIIITNYGKNYTYANISIVGNGVGCILRGILSPFGGHGKNSVLELNARTLMFFTTLSNEKNQGISVNNDSRQLGIVKSLSRYNSNLSFRGDIGSGCYLLNCGANIDTSKFYVDLKLTTGQKEYYVVSVSANKILITSLINSIPSLGDIFTTQANDKITPIEIIPPTIDKYSGTMLFIDNRNAFSTTSEQSLSLRTTIKF